MGLLGAFYHSTGLPENFDTTKGGVRRIHAPFNCQYNSMCRTCFLTVSASFRKRENAGLGLGPGCPEYTPMTDKNLSNGAKMIQNGFGGHVSGHTRVKKGFWKKFFLL